MAIQYTQLVMAMNVFTIFPSKHFFFSTFKKKVAPLLSTDHRTPSELFLSLSSFQSTLSPLQLKKMPKMLQTFNRRFRRLLRQSHPKIAIDVPMELSHTYEAYTRNVDQLMFGTQEMERQTNIDEIKELTAQMVKYDLDIYLKQLIITPQTYNSLSQRMLQRFINIDQRISRQLFRGYFGFSRTVSKIAFLEQRQYKGDFKFQLIDDLPKLQKGIDAIYNCALFNKMRDKVSLACELAITTKYHHLNDKSIGKLLFCLGSSGRSLKFIQENFQEIKERVGEKYPLELLYYMMVSGIEDTVWFHLISNRLVLEPKNIHEQSLAKMVKIILRERFECNVQVKQREEYARPCKKHEGELFFEDFLRRYGYQYSQTPLELFPYTVYSIQGKQFLCYDSLAIKDQAFPLSGVGLMIAQYFHGRSQEMKHINWPRMMGMEKRGERDEYILSKFKGIERPKRVKVRYYE